MRAGGLLRGEHFSDDGCFDARQDHHAVAATGHALAVLGGVPVGKVRYDDLKAALAKVLGLSPAWVEADRWPPATSEPGCR
jgi:hypothetical protein